MAKKKDIIEELLENGYRRLATAVATAQCEIAGFPTRFEAQMQAKEIIRETLHAMKGKKHK